MATQEIEYLKEKLHEFRELRREYFALGPNTELHELISHRDRYHLAAVAACRAAEELFK